MVTPKPLSEGNVDERVYNLIGYGAQRLDAYELLDRNIDAANELLRLHGLEPLLGPSYQSYRIDCASNFKNEDPVTGFESASVLSETGFDDAELKASRGFFYGFKIHEFRKTFTYVVDASQMDVLNPTKDGP